MRKFRMFFIKFKEYIKLYTILEYCINKFIKIGIQILQFQQGAIITSNP